MDEFIFHHVYLGWLIIKIVQPMYWFSIIWDVSIDFNLICDLGQIPFYVKVRQNMKIVTKETKQYMDERKYEEVK